METHIKIVGFILIGLSLLHIIIPRYFQWKKESESLSLITRQILYVHTFFIAFMVLLMGILCLNFSHELTHDDFGRAISLGLFVFWLTRLIFQFFVYSTKLWKGKGFETTVHILFSLTWIYLTGVFFLTSFSRN